jgi:Protein of unknown function (DUF2794)
MRHAEIFVEVLAPNTERRDHDGSTTVARKQPDHQLPTYPRRRRMLSGDTDPSEPLRGAGASAPYAPAVTFSRRELDRILGLYGRMVAAGEWRDYAIDFLKDRAVFSIFRRSAEVPIYRVEKNPRLARRQGAYSVISATGLIMRRGHELDRVLAVLDNTKLAVVN